MSWNQTLPRALCHASGSLRWLGTPCQVQPGLTGVVLLVLLFLLPRLRPHLTATSTAPSKTNKGAHRC
jgi:hypothetical protein